MSWLSHQTTQLSIFGSKDLRLLERVGELNAFLSLRFSPDGRHLAGGLQGPTISVWDTRDWTRHSLRGHHMIPFDITFSPDGQRMVTGSDRLVIWDTDTWQQLARYKLPIMTIDRVIFSPDGNDLIVSDAEAIRIWRAPSIEDIEEREARLGRWH